MYLDNTRLTQVIFGLCYYKRCSECWSLVTAWVTFVTSALVHATFMMPVGKTLYNTVLS